jgi:hypothetical protein
MSPHDRKPTALIPKSVNKSASTSSYRPSTFNCERSGMCPVVIQLEERLSALDREVRQLKDYRPSTESKPKPKPETDILDCEEIK